VRTTAQFTPSHEVTMHVVRLAAFATCVAGLLAVGGCRSDRSDITGPSATAPRVALSAEGVGPMVIGSGHTSVGIANDLREFTFHAVQHPDGSVSGGYRVQRADIGVFFTVDVTCMAVVANTGWVAGIITETNAPNVVVGSVSSFWVRDNGEGEGDAADIVSTARINGAAGTDVAFCNARPLVLPPNTVEFGNVQVR
jgi:hypothetical protein